MEKVYKKEITDMWLKKSCLTEYFNTAGLGFL